MSKRISYPHIVSRVFDKPHLIAESKMRAILRALGPRIGFELEAPQVPLQAMDDDGPFVPPDPFAHMEYLQALGVKLEPMPEGYFRGEGVAILPVTGTLVQRSDWMTDTSGMQSYGRLERMMNAALEDSNVHELLWEFDTPGGEVAGAFDFADRIYDARGVKPMTASVNELAASAGYLLASAVGNIAVSRTSAVGSIGVVAAHYDYSAAMEKRGVAITFVYAGDRKVDGNPYQPLSEQAKKDWQDEIDDTYALFLETVARNTGLSVGKIRSTQAAIYTGQKAIDAGLAQRLNTFSNEFNNSMLRAKEKKPNPYSRMSAEDARPKWMSLGVRESTINHWLEPKSSSTVAKENDMSGTNTTTTAAPATTVAAAPAAPVPPTTEVPVVGATITAPAAPTTAPADNQAAIAAAVQADRKRSSDIMSLPEAKGRETLAQKCVDKGMTVEDAKDMLASSPKRNALNDAMEQIGGPQVRSEETERQPAKIDTPDEIYARRAAIFAGGQAQARR